MSVDFTTIYRAELGYALRTLRRLAVPEADLPDAAHEMFVDVYEKLGSYDTSRPLRPWLFGFAYRVARDFRRRNDRRHAEPLDGVTDLVDPSAAPEKDMHLRQKQRLALRCLAALPEEQAAILVLHEFDDMSVPEISRILSIPLNTAYSRLRLARNALEKAALQIVQRDDR